MQFGVYYYEFQPVVDQEGEEVKIGSNNSKKAGLFGQAITK